MASPYGPALGTPGFGAAAAAHGTPMTGGRFQMDDAFGSDARFGGGFGSGSNPNSAFEGDAFATGAHAAVRDRDLRTSAAPDYAPLLFGASPGPGGPGPTPARGGFEHAGGAYGVASLHTPGPAARRTPGFFGGGAAGRRPAPYIRAPGERGSSVAGSRPSPAAGPARARATFLGASARLARRGSAARAPRGALTARPRATSARRGPTAGAATTAVAARRSTRRAAISRPRRTAGPAFPRSVTTSGGSRCTASTPTAS